MRKTRPPTDLDRLLAHLRGPAIAWSVRDLEALLQATATALSTRHRADLAALKARLGGKPAPGGPASRAFTDATHPDRPLRSGVRRPFMDPFNVASDMYSISKRRPVPAWAVALAAQGWSLEELHYKRHAAAMRARGLEPLYDAVARHAELVALDPPRLSRTVKIKK